MIHTLRAVACAAALCALSFALPAHTRETRVAVAALRLLAALAAILGLYGVIRHRRRQRPT